MKEHVSHAASMNAYYAQIHLSDIPGETWCELPEGIPYHPAWIVGHVASSYALVGRLIGVDTGVPEAWTDLFGWGSSAGPDASTYPAKDELISVFQQSHMRLVDRLGTATAEELAAENPHEMIRRFFPTVGDCIVSILTVHTATHLGQLSVWRRAMGLELKM